MNEKKYQFTAVIQKVPEIDGAYIEFPYDVRAEFGKGRVKVQVVFDGHNPLMRQPCADENPRAYSGGAQRHPGKLGKQPGDLVDVLLWERP